MHEQGGKRAGGDVEELVGRALVDLSRDLLNKLVLSSEYVLTGIELNQSPALVFTTDCFRGGGSGHWEGRKRQRFSRGADSGAHR